MTTMLTRYFFSLTQTQLILSATISAVFATIFTIIWNTGTVMLTGYFFAVGYMTIDFFSVQKKYSLMLRTMPISADTMVKMQFSYMIRVCVIYGIIFLALFLFYSAIRADVSVSLMLTVISVLVGGSLLFLNILFILEYTLKSGSNLFLILIVLFVILGGYRFIISFFKNLSSMSFYNTSLLIFAAIMVGVTIANFRFIVRLYEHRDHA